MNANELKAGLTEKSNTMKDKAYTLQGFLSKVNKSDQHIYGNYYVDFNELFSDTNECTNYMKKKVSLFNNENVEKKQLKLNLNSNIKPAYFSKFSLETLFYMFYYMPRDTLQLFAAEELYKRKWKYHSEYSVWFSTESSDQDKTMNELNMYFNPIEWKVMKYVYGPLNAKAFLSHDEVLKYIKQLNIEK